MKFCQLTTRKVDAAKRPGYHSDGAGLYLQIAKGGTKAWVFRYAIGGKRREMGLGSARVVTLKQARQLAREAREHLLRADDPIALRQTKRDKVRADAAKRMTFREALDGCLAARSSEWRSDKHRRQWRASVEQHVLPILGSLPVDAIDVPHILKALEPIWREKPVTAERVRGRIERILSWATAGKYRHGDNPAAWKGALEHLLPAPTKIKKVTHLAALPYADVPAFVAELRAQDSVHARALEFLILTAVRSANARGARWDDIKGNVWTIPGRDMKTGHEFRVPLSGRAREILEELGPPRRGLHVFTTEAGRQLTGDDLLDFTQRLRADITVHGFRTAFRNWAAARTNFPREISELALAHQVKNKTEEAYWRDDALERRARLMQEWARYCSAPAQASAQVVALR